MISSKLKVSIPQHATAFDAYLQVLRTLLHVVEANRPGAIADIDIEFLHDLRVGVRRARSVLRTAGDVLPRVMIDDLSERLRWLQQVTGSARDLDVWVLGFDHMAETFPAGSRASLEPLRAYLEKERVAQHDRLAHALESRQAHETLASWRGVVEHALPSRETPLADDSAGPVASRHVRRALRKTLTLGSRIDDDSPNEDLHELRIKAKQLRYLLECFAAVLPSEQTGDLIPRLKTLQDVLGDHQDCSLQIQEVGQFARVLEGEAPTDTILVMGELTASLRDRQHELRGLFAKRFARFEAAGRPYGKAKR